MEEKFRETKKIILASLCLALAISFGGCSQASYSTSSGATSEKSPSITSAESPDLSQNSPVILPADTPLVSPSVAPTSSPYVSSSSSINGVNEKKPEPSPAASTNINNKFVNAYTSFLLNYNMDEDPGFPVYGFYLVDLNFDNEPELAVLHLSGGSMGGYFTYYYMNGDRILPVKNDDASKSEISNYTQLLEDSKNKKIYLLKEMYLLRGNENGTYGYVQEVVNSTGAPHVHNILSLEVKDIGFNEYPNITHNNEDDFLSDSRLNNYLEAKHYVGDVWQNITAQKYLDLKRSLIPKDNDFVNLLDKDPHYYLYSSESEINFDNLNKTTEAGIETLFSEWFQQIAK
jgi:hypothetical protein